MTTVTESNVPKGPPAPRSGKGGGRAWIGILIGVIAFAAGALLSGRILSAVRPEHSTSAAESTDADNSAPSADPVKVKTVRVSPGGITRLSSQVGSVHPYETADLYAKVSGYLKNLYVDYGSKVKRGDVLAEIDDPEAVKEDERAAAALAQAKAAVVQEQARVQTAAADLKAAQAAVEQAKAEIQRATSKRRYREKVLARYRDLVARNAEPQQVVDEQEENYESARADEFAAKAAEATANAQAAASQARVDKAKADLAEAQANVAVAEANLAKARVIVAYMTITSPYDGLVVKRTYFPGAFIRSAAEGESLPLLTVQRTDVVRVATVVPDRDVPKADVGDTAEVTLDALPGKVFKGKISRFSGIEDPATRTMYTEVDLPNPDGLLKPGMYGIARIVLDTDAKRSTIPTSCLAGELKGDRADVLVVRDGRAHKVSIRIGADDGMRVEVVEGLSAEDQVIDGKTSLAEGTPVQPLAEEKRSS